ncbi:MAG TPA: osmotically inducible protein OsmC [Clostridiales bacterium]|jgi:putative redox protein|nr:osmotically inducible protein OsmC [Clostridiales bacterium]
MTLQRVELNFQQEFKGQLIAENHAIDIGTEKGSLAPYDMLLGALASCYYSTFLDVVKKKKITYDKVEMIVTGEKRTEIPTTLQWVNLDIRIYGASTQKGILKAGELAAKYCSVYQTISKVAEMNWSISFEPQTKM